ncbi:MAG: NAD-dependent deacetylase, partial [Acidimicrobiia bacterium]|nr:NAD-dependent deacetylase [Acidimicrobiia bacterium]
MTSQVERLGNLIGDASRVVVLTGAGISTASGIPDFRGPDGVWRTLRPITFDRFVRDPRARREYWHQKVLAEPLVAAAEPNAVHHACTRLEHDGRLDTVITQNVDGLHTAAGTSRSSLVEIHGNAREAVCLSCDRR